MVTLAEVHSTYVYFFQLTGLAMLLLDPYYRTIIGFEVRMQANLILITSDFAF